MNCDRAFDLMTSADRQDDPELLRHLEHCPRCREMQETLSPALEWLSVGPQPEWSDLGLAPSETGPLLSAQAVRIAEDAARDLAARRALSLPAVYRRAISIAVVLMCGIALGMAGLDGNRGSSERPADLAGGSLSACLWTSENGRSQLPNSSAQAVVASCVVCHVPPTVK